MMHGQQNIKIRTVGNCFKTVYFLPKVKLILVEIHLPVSERQRQS
jgi:hypothetical protein